MFKKAIMEIRKELETNLQPGLKKCASLEGKVPVGKTKTKLLAKRAEFSGAVDRAALCLDILEFRVALEISDDWKVVKLIGGGK